MRDELARPGSAFPSAGAVQLRAQLRAKIKSATAEFFRAQVSSCDARANEIWCLMGRKTRTTLVQNVWRGTQ